MNRSIVLIGVSLIGFGFALVAYPIAFTGAEQLDIEQELGFLVAPVGLVVVMLGALAQDPTRTTVGGAFGNPYAELERPTRAPPVEPRARRLFNPHQPADCPVLPNGHHLRPGPVSPMRAGPRLPELRAPSRNGERPSDLSDLRSDGGVLQLSDARPPRRDQSAERSPVSEAVRTVDVDRVIPRGIALPDASAPVRVHFDGSCQPPGGGASQDGGS